jgi:hypothetical protein
MMHLQCSQSPTSDVLRIHLGNRQIFSAFSAPEKCRAIEGLSSKQHNLQHTDPLFAKYGIMYIMKVEDIIRHQQRIDGFLAIKHHLPSSINSLLISPSEVHQHFTRAAGFSLM